MTKNNRTTGHDNDPANGQFNPEGLPFVDDGVVLVDTPEALNRVLAHRGQDLSSLMIDFDVREWREFYEEKRIDICQFLGKAVEQVCAAGLLPRSRDQLPPFGTRVEAMVVGGKPGPEGRYGTGTVKGHSWDCLFHTWRVAVTFYEPAGYYCGAPIRGTSTFPSMVHVIGSDERPFSTMTPAEIEALHEKRRLEFWRSPGPTASLKERQEFWRNLDAAARTTDPSSPAQSLNDVTPAAHSPTLFPRPLVKRTDALIERSAALEEGCARYARHEDGAAKPQGGRPSGGSVPLDEAQRRHLTEDTFRELLESGKERAYVVFSNLDQPHEHVRFLFEYGLFAADVCSREWGTVPRPLPDEAVERLAKLGFVRSTRFRLNFGKSGLSPDARALAELLETLFREAYETPSKFPLGTRIELHPTPDAPGANPDRLGWTDAVP